MRLRATPPALRDMRNTVTPGSLLKALIMRSRASMLILPSSRTHRIPTCAHGMQHWGGGGVVGAVQPTHMHTFYL